MKLSFQIKSKQLVRRQNVLDLKMDGVNSSERCEIWDLVGPTSKLVKLESQKYVFSALVFPKTYCYIVFGYTLVA